MSSKIVLITSTVGTTIAGSNEMRRRSSGMAVKVGNWYPATENPCCPFKFFVYEMLSFRSLDRLGGRIA